MNEYKIGVWYPWGSAGNQEDVAPVPEGTMITVIHRDGEVYNHRVVGSDIQVDSWDIDEEAVYPGDIMAFMVEE